MKPKFKMSKQEMLKFNDDCNNACPKYVGTPLITNEEILNGTISAKRLVKLWNNCDTLVEYDCYEYLSLDSLEIFDRYKLYKSEKRKYKLENA